MQKNYLILALSLSIIGCNQAPKFPESMHKYAIDLPNKKCHEFVMVDVEKQTYKFVQSLSIESCDGYFAANPSETVTVSNWIRDVISWAKTKQHGN